MALFSWHTVSAAAAFLLLCIVEVGAESLSRREGVTRKTPGIIFRTNFSKIKIYANGRTVNIILRVLPRLGAGHHITVRTPEHGRCDQKKNEVNRKCRRWRGLFPYLFNELFFKEGPGVGLLIASVVPFY